MTESESRNSPTLSPTTTWLICAIAALGFAFDIYELLMLPLIVRPALMGLGGINPGSPEFNHWVGLLFYVPAVCGGIFGLIGGYLTDRFGRRQVLTYSILLYAFSAAGAGFATSLPVLLVLRCTTFIGVCVEFVAAVAWLAELFTDPKQREKVLGYTQAFSSVGGLLVTGAWYLANQVAHQLPPIHGENEAWRYTLISGVLPALPLIIIRPFLPESPSWQLKKAAGTLRRPSFGELFQPAHRRTTVVTALMMACSYGAAFGAIQHLPRIVPGIPSVARSVGGELTGALPALENLPPPARVSASRALVAASQKPRAEQEAAVLAIPQLSTLTPEQQQSIVTGLPRAAAAAGVRREEYVSAVSAFQEVGGLVGRFLLAVLAVIIVSRRALLRVFQVPGLILIPLVFLFPAQHDVEMLKWGIFLCGVLTVAQFSFWGNYLPRVYPIHLRGTGESFAANIGGRMIGTSAALITVQLANVTPGETPPAQLANAAAAVGFAVYLLGFIASFWLPEPKQEELPE